MNASPISGRKVVLALASAAMVSLAAYTAPAQSRDNIQKPIAGPRAAALRVTWLYVSPDPSAQKVGRVQIGREMVVAEKSGDWLRVFANTDVKELQDQRDQPWVGGENDMPPPISGWIQAKGIVEETTAGGDQILFGAAANQEAAASDPAGPANAARSAEYLYRRVAEMFQKSPLAPEAAWRAADIQWQIQKADQASRPSAKEQAPYLREGIDESAMKHVIKLYPRTPQAAKAAFEMLDNKLCGDWQGQEKCPEREADLYEHYAAAFPDGPRTARALYEALYRTTVLVDMFHDNHDDKKADAARKHAHVLLDEMTKKFATSDYTARAAALVFKSDQGIPVYGIDME